MILNFFNTIIILVVLITTGCVVGEIQAPVDESGATIGPSLSSVTPSSGPLAGSTSVSLSGQNFSTGMSVSIGGVACSSVAVSSSTSATCTTGANSIGAKDVVITDSEGNSDTLFSGFTYRTTPSVTGISPSEGSTLGGTTVTISGTGFFSGATVTINSVSCTSVNVTSSTSLTCLTGAQGAGGPYTVSVTNDDGQAGSGGSFTYSLPPTVTSVTPNFGAIAGGTNITISGSNFAGPAGVSINGILCSSVTVVDPNTITCLTGDNSASGIGTYDIVVTNSNLVEGTGSNAFTYLGPPTITSISPNAGNHTPSGGAATDNDVVIAGTNFVTGATVFFDLDSDGVNDAGEACGGLTVDSATQISCDRPDSGTTGNVAINVYVENVDGQRSAAGTFTYQDPPAITSTVADNGFAIAGGVAGGAVLDISGSNFISPSVVVGSTACTVSSATASLITCTTGTGTLGTANVVVTNSDGQSATDTGAFTYQVTPTLTSISPTAGVPGSPAAVTFTGTNFTAASGIKAYFGGVECSGYSAIGATSFSCTPPNGTADTSVDVSVVIQDAAEQTATLSGGYRYEAAPTLTSVSPTAGGHSPTDRTITLTGTNFRSGATVFFDLNGNRTDDGAGEDCGTVNVVNSTTITCERPDSGTTGTLAVDVYVVNTGPQSASLASAHTYQDAPTLTGISKNGGTNTGFVPALTLTGTNFRSGLSITIGGQACISSVFTNATTASCSAPTGVANGTYDVVLTNSDGQTATLTNGFTFQPAPTITSISPPGGPLDGSLTFTITGTNFTDADTAVARVGTTACETTTVVNSTTITCDPPAFGIEAFRDVSVELSDGGNQKATLTNGYRYANAPTVTDISPFGGSTFGGTDVTITGTNFQTGATVKLGTRDCINPVVVDANTITCTTTSDVPGTVAVNVTNPDTQVSTVTDNYIYATPPTVSGVSPNNASINGGSTVTISGGSFNNPSAVAYINNVACDTGSSVVDANTISCVVPAGAAANTAYDIKVVNPDGSEGIYSSSFTYVNEPTITNVTPGIGPTSGTDGDGNSVTITITGTNFDTVRGIQSITLNGQACTVISPFTSTEVTCTLQAGTAGNGDVVLTNNDGDPTSATLSNGFTYIDAPTITTVNGLGSGVTGPAEGGTTLTIVGTGFFTGLTTTISIGALGTCDSVNVTSSTNLTCVTSAGIVGTADITLTNFDGQKATFSDFTYQPGPEITSINPSSGSTLGGGSVTLTGTNFKYFGVSDPSVSVGGTPCSTISFTGVNTVVCTLPPGAAGAADIVLQNPAPDSQSFTLSGSFTYVAPPTISSVSPSVVALGRTTDITINGTNFYDEGGGVTVVIGPGAGDYACASPTVVSPTQITCTVPSSILAGSYSIRVTNDDGSAPQSVTSGASAINAVAAPTIASITPSSGVLAGGETITINGTGFTSTPLPEVTVGGQSCTSVNATGAPTSITCVTPASTNPTATTASTVDTVVRIYPSASPAITNSTTGTTDDFTYNPLPVVTSAVTSLYGNAFGDDDGGQEITITGNNFVSAPTSVMIGTAACTPITFDSTTQIRCTSGANTTTDTALDVVVTNPDGQVGTGTGLFTYLDPPAITNVSPTGGINTGGEDITITGSNFTNDATVTVGGSTCPVTSRTGETTIVCTSPVFGTPTQTHNVVVQNRDGQTATAAGAWQSQVKPTISSISPDNGDESGGTSVTITGTNFEAGAVVLFGASSQPIDSITGTTSLTVTAPSGTANEVVNVVVRNPTTQVSSETFTWTFNPAAPEIEWQVGGSSPNPPNPATYSSTAVATNQSQTFTLRNVGAVTSGSLTISITGLNSGAFFVNSDTCTGNTLPPYTGPSDECTVDVIFLGEVVTDGVAYSATLNATDGTSTSTNGLEANP